MAEISQEERICPLFFSNKPLRASILRIYTGIDPRRCSKKKKTRRFHF